MKTIRRAWALLCALVLLVSAVPLMPVIAENTTTGIGLEFTVDNATPSPGEIVTLSVVVNGANTNEYWNVLQFEIGYDADKIEPVLYTDKEGRVSEFAAGEALLSGTAMASVSFEDYTGAVLNPIKAAVVSSQDMTRSGEVMRIRFRVKESVVDGEQVMLTPRLQVFSRSVVHEDLTATTVPLAQAGTETLTMTVTGSLLPDTGPVTFTVDKTSASVGEYITLTMTLEELTAPHWNLLDFAVKYDADKVEPVLYTDDAGRANEFAAGAVLQSGSAMALVSFEDYTGAALNPVLGSIISSADITATGDILSIRFQVKDTVNTGDTIAITPILNRLAQSVIKDNTSTMVELAPQGSVELAVQVRSLAGIALDAAPTKLEYTVGEALDMTDGKVAVLYDDNTTKIIDLSQATVTGFDPNKVGKQTLTVTYSGKTTTFDVTVKPAYILGDLNDSKTVTAEDALLALQGATKKIALSDVQILAGDVTDRDGAVTANDALTILQYATQKITAFPVEI